MASSIDRDTKGESYGDMLQAQIGRVVETGVLDKTGEGPMQDTVAVPLVPLRDTHNYKNAALSELVGSIHAGDFSPRNDQTSSTAELNHYIPKLQATVPKLSARAPAVSLSAHASGFRFPLLEIYAALTVNSPEEFFYARIDTGADRCLMTSEVAVSRFGFDQVDWTSQGAIRPVGDGELKTLGEIDIEFRVAASPNRYRTTFNIVPDNYLDCQCGVIFSESIIVRMQLLVTGPGYFRRELGAKM